MAEEAANNLQESGEFGPKLTDWAKEPSLSELKLDWEASKSYHSTQVAKIDHWNNVLHVRNGVKPKKRKGRSSVQPKLVRRQYEWRYPALTEPFLGTDTLFNVKPATFEDTTAARQNQLLLNHQFRNQMNLVKFIDDFVRYANDDGTCVLQAGWTRQTIEITEEVPVYEFVIMTSEEDAQVLQAAIQLEESNPREYKETVPDAIKAAVDYYNETGKPTIAHETGEFEEVTVEKVLKNQPTAKIHNPRNVAFDPSCEGDIDKALYACVTFETTKADLLKEGKRYNAKQLEKVNWENAGPLSQPDHETKTPMDFQLKDSLRKKVVAFEYWGFHDINNDGRLVPIVVTWIGDIIIRMEVSPYPDEKLPFIVVPFLPVKGELYGEPDAELLEDNQAVLGAVMRGMIDLMGRSANGQQGMAKGMLDPLNRKRYEAGEDYEFNPNLTPAAGLIEHKFPELPGSAMNMVQLQNFEAEGLTGVKSFSGGMSGQAFGDVAAGVRGMLDAAAKRELSILRRLAKGITELAKKFAAMNAVWLSEEEVVRITNDEFVTINRDDLAGNFDIIIAISTAEVDNAQAQDLGFMLQTIGPDEDPAIRRKILAKIADLKRMPDFAEEIRNYKPEPDPLDMKIKELQIAKLEMEIQELQAEAQLKQAKAKEALANADKKNLDYVEQETGTTHERDMQKTRGQAKGNIDLAIASSLVKPTKDGEKKGDVDAAIGFRHLLDNEDESEDDIPGMPESLAGGASPIPAGQDPAVI
jgi:hypothetical protein